MKKLVKKQAGGMTPSNKQVRLSNRADKVMGKAQKNWKKGTAAMAYDESSKPETSNAVGYGNRLLNKAARQEERAKDLKARAGMKKGGTVKKK